MPQGDWDAGMFPLAPEVLEPTGASSV